MCVSSLFALWMPDVQSIREGWRAMELPVPHQQWGMPHPGGWTEMCSQLPLLPSLQMTPHTLPHTPHLPYTPQKNRRTATTATGLCRGRDFSGETLAICRTTDSFLWAFPCWIILSRPNMLTGSGAQPALYPLTGHHHIPAKDWKSKEKKSKQKVNCMLRRKKETCSLQAI